MVAVLLVVVFWLTSSWRRVHLNVPGCGCMRGVGWCKWLFELGEGECLRFNVPERIAAHQK